MTDAGENAAGVQQVRYRAKRCRRGCVRRCRRIQVGPGGRDERARTILEDQNEIQLAVAPHPTKQWERPALQWVPGSDDRDFGRVPLEVGSVLPFRSTKFRTLRCCNEYESESETNACWRWLRPS